MMVNRNLLYLGLSALGVIAVVLGYGYGNRGLGGIGIVLIVLVVLVLTGRL